MGIPDRPRIDKDMITKVAERMADELITKISSANDVEFVGSEDAYKQEIVKDLLRVYHYGMDGYQIAKKLDDQCLWDCDKEIVDILDDMELHIHAVESKFVEEWVKQYSPQPDLRIGTKIKEGIIEGTHERFALYKVKPYNDTRDGCWLLIPYEKAQAI